VTDRATIKATYTLTLHKDTLTLHNNDRGQYRLSEQLLRETEENITDLLPDGWWVEIHTWDEPEPSGSIVYRDPEDDSGFFQ
jgi:hypothetical protein